VNSIITLGLRFTACFGLPSFAPITISKNGIRGVGLGVKESALEEGKIFEITYLGPAPLRWFTRSATQLSPTGGPIGRCTLH